MLPIVHLHVTRDLVHAEVPGIGVIMEEPAAIVVVYGAHSGRRILAVGKLASAVELRGFDPIDPAKVTDKNDLFTRPAKLEEAPWWREDAPQDFDPWDHNGEYVVVWPFRPETYEPELAAAMLRYFGARACSPEHAHRVGKVVRFWLSLRAPIVHIDQPPPTTEAHLSLGRHLSPLNLRDEDRPRPPPPRPFADFSWQQWAEVVGFPLVLIAAMGASTMRRATWFLLFSVGLGVWMARIALARIRAEGSRHEFSRETLAKEAAARAGLRRFEALPTGEAGGDYAGDTARRLGTTGLAMLVPAAFGLALPVLLRVYEVRILGSTSDVVEPAIGFLIIALFCVGALVGNWLAGTTLSVGQRGLTLRSHGIFQRPMFIPFAAIRSAAMLHRDPPQPFTQLRILLVDGDEITLPVSPLPAFWRTKKVALAAEEAILSRLGPPRRYRVAP